ncbi:DNA-protecting protein DprA [bacterium]|nr:DNA-protecting protein DprA [bacterium]
MADGVHDRSADREAGLERERAHRLGLVLLAPPSDGYPPLLRDVPDPPPVLRVKGSLDALSAPAVAVVGSRRAGELDLKFARRLGRDLADAGVVVVSGLARGIDRAAHEGALEARNGRTVAVQACGLARTYPADHVKLALRIAERGALVSELPVDAPPLAFHFPMRNRIVSGLARGTVVLAAPEGSGALITADHALEQGREVYAVPGAVHDPFARGPNGLLRNGAHVLEAAQDILLGLGFVRPRAGVPDRPPLATRAQRPPLPGVAGELEAYLAGSGIPRTFDEIVIHGGFDARAAMCALGRLEVSRRVKQLPGGAYACTD